MKYLLAFLMLPLTLLFELWGAIVVLYGIIELRLQMFFKDDLFEEAPYQNTLIYKILLSIPLILLTLIEIAIIIPLYLCHRIINSIMAAIPFLMILPSIIAGAILGIILLIFNNAHYILLHPSKRAYFTASELSKIHPTAIMSQKMEGRV